MSDREPVDNTASQQTDSSEQRALERQSSNADDKMSREIADSQRNSTTDNSLWRESSRSQMVASNLINSTEVDPRGQQFMPTSRNGELQVGSPNYLYRDRELQAGLPPGGQESLGESAYLGRAPGRGAVAPAESLPLRQSENSGRRQDRVREAGDRPAESSNMDQARENLRQSLEARGMSAAQIRDVMQNMQRMEDRLRTNPAQTRDGRLNPEQEAKQAYDAMTRLARGDAQRESNGVPLSRRDVNNVLLDAASRMGDPENKFDQGRHNTCALEASARQEAWMSPSSYASRLADIANTGQFTDGRGRQTVLDKNSLALDNEAQSYPPARGSRGGAGQLQDIAYGQYASNVRSNTWGDSQRFTYQQTSPSSRGDTGEQLVDNRSGRVVADNPAVDGNTMGAMKQGLFGDRFSDTFGRDTTLVNAAAFNGRHMTSFSEGSALQAHLQANESKGWGMSTMAVHTGNWNRNGSFGGDGGSGGGWHAVSVRSEGNNIREVNNWGGEHNHLRTADQALADGRHPQGQNGQDFPGPDGERRRDHVFDNGKHGDKDTVRETLDHDKKNKDQKEQEEKDQRLKDKEKEGAQREKDKEAKDKNKIARMAFISAEIASLRAQMSALKQSGSSSQLQSRIADLQANEKVEQT